MSYNSPSNDLDNDEIMSYLNMKDIGLGDWVKKFGEMVMSGVIRLVMKNLMMANTIVFQFFLYFL